MAKELVVGTFIDRELTKTSSLNGSEVCFVITVENFNNFVEKTCNSNYQDLAILMRYECDDKFADDYLQVIERSKAPHNQKWYWRENLDESLDTFGRMTNYKAKVYRSKKDQRNKTYETRKFKTKN